MTWDRTVWRRRGWHPVNPYAWEYRAFPCQHLSVGVARTPEAAFESIASTRRAHDAACCEEKRASGKH